MSFCVSSRHPLSRAPATSQGVTQLSGRGVLILCCDETQLVQGQSLSDICRQLRAQGATALVAGPWGGLQANFQVDVQANWGDFACVPINLRLDQRGYFAQRRIQRRLRQIVARGQVHVIHAVGGHAAVQGARLAEACALPFAATLTEPLSQLSLRAAEATIAAQRVFLTNPEFAPEFLSMAPQCEERVLLAPPGVDLAFLSPTAVRTTALVEIMEQLAVPHDKPVLLIKCSAQGQAVHQLIFQALAELAPLTFYPIFEVPRGESQLRDGLVYALDRLGLGAQGRVVERGTDPRYLYQICETVLIDAYPPLGFNAFIAEAGAFGKPALVPLVEGVRAQVQHDVNGWIFTTQGHHTLKAALVHALMLSIERRRTVQAAAQLHVRHHFDARESAQQVLAVYEAMLVSGQAFVGVEDMVDFDGDPLELAQRELAQREPAQRTFVQRKPVQTDPRSRGILLQERRHRQHQNLRERSLAARDLLRDVPSHPSGAAGQGPHSAVSPTFAKTGPLDAAPVSRQKVQDASWQDRAPASQGGGLTLLDLVKRPGAPALGAQAGETSGEEEGVTPLP